MWGCALLVLVIVVVMVPLSALARQNPLNSGVTGLALAVPFAAVGVVVAGRQPGNPIGWLCFVFAICFLASVDAGYYLVAVYRLGRHLPFGSAMLFLQPLWATGLAALALGILLFPDGRLPSARWRGVLGGYVLLCALELAGTWAEAAAAITGHRIHVDTGGDLIVAASSTPWLKRAGGVILVLLLISWLCFAVRQLLSWRRSSGDRREQLKWLATGAAVSVAAVVISVAVGSSSPLARAIGNVLGFGLVATPVGIGVAILKYRLYEIDRIISRTLSYTLVTGLLVGVYAGVVLLTTRVLGISSAVGVAASTLAAAALFNPLRLRVQRLVDRRFNRARYDADRTVTAFASRLQDATDPDAVRADLLATVGHALTPTHSSLWLSRTAQR